MMKKESKTSSLWQQILKFLKTFLISFRKFFSTCDSNTLQLVQLTFIYFFAIIDLTYAILNNIFGLGYLPQVLVPFFPFIKAVLNSAIFKVWGSPEKVFFLSYVVIEFMVVRSTFKFSKLVKYNILLIFAMLMVQGLVISYWDLLFHREISTPIAKWAYGQGGFIHTDRNLAIAFFLNTFVIFVLTYMYLFFKAMRGKYATIPGMEWLTDSVAFWLRIKTPTMRLGGKKGKKK